MQARPGIGGNPVAPARSGEALALAVVSHELRGPLAALRAHTEVLSGSPSLRGDDLEALAAIARAGERLERILDHLIDLARPRAAGAAPDEVARVALVSRSVAEAVDTAGPEALRAGIVIDVDAVGDDGDQGACVPIAQVDLDRAVLNLVTNAVKFSPAGRRVLVEHGPAGEMVRIAVHDQGVGVHPDDVSRIFDPFVRAASPGRPAPGSGLGLAIVREIVEHAGGEITVHSRPGSGSTFTLWLPSTAAADLPAPRGRHRA